MFDWFLTFWQLQGQNLATFSHSAVTPIAYLPLITRLKNNRSTALVYTMWFGARVVRTSDARLAVEAGRSTQWRCRLPHKWARGRFSLDDISCPFMVLRYCLYVKLWPNRWTERTVLLPDAFSRLKMANKCLQCSPDSLAGFSGSTSEGEEEEEKRGD